MNDDLNTQRKKAFAEAGQAVQDMYAGIDLAEALGNVIKNYNVPDNARSSLIHAIGDAVLGLYPKKEILLRLIEGAELPEESAKRILDEMKSFIDQSSKPEPLKTEPSKNIPAPQHTPRAEEGSTTTTPLTRDDIMRALNTKRTMDGDIANLTDNK